MHSYHLDLKHGPLFFAFEPLARLKGGEDMTKLVWFISINGAIGVPVFFIGVFTFVVYHSMKYSVNVVDEYIDRLIEQENDIYDATNHPQLWKAVSTMLTIFLWEAMLPIAFKIIHDGIVDLYNIKHRP